MRPSGLKIASSTIVAIVVTMLALAACGDDGDSPATDVTSIDGTTTATEPDAVADTTTSAPGPTTTGAAPTTEPANTTPPTTTGSAPSAAGWLAVDAFAAHAFEVAPIEDAVASAQSVLGPPTSDEVNAECGAGPIRTVAWDGLHLLSFDGELDGWFYRGTDPAMSTPSGATVGATLADLQALFPDGEMTTDTLGPEFVLSIDTTSGPRFLGALLTDTQPSATVTSLYAGLTCFFR